MRCAVFLLCLLAPLAAAAEGTNEPIGLKGAPGVVTPPSGAWTQTHDSPAPGQWFVQYAPKAGIALLRAHVFPVRHNKNPEKVLVQAIDTFFRGQRASFGMPTAGALDVWGCPAAEASIMAVLGGRVIGRARLVLLSKHQWGFAIGYAQDNADAATRNAVAAFVSSLEPREPVFYERRFHDPATYARDAVRVPGDEPVTVGELAAVARVLEEGIGARYPVALLPAVRQALTADALKGTTRTRAGYRSTKKAIEKAAAFEPEKREETLRAIGQRVLKAILERASGGYEPAVQFTGVWNEFRALRIGTREDGLTAGDLANRIEMSEFIASIAADKEVRATGKPRDELVFRTNAKWKDTPKAERDGWRKIGALWSALRYAWDKAKPEGRFAFRRAVVARLASAETRPQSEELSDARALKRWRSAHPQDASALMDAAFDLSLADRRALIDALGVKDAYGFHFGW